MPLPCCRVDSCLTAHPLGAVRLRAWCCLLFACVLLAESACAAGGGRSAADYNAAGVEQYNAHQWSGAIESFSQAYALAPDNPTVRRNLCNAYQASANELARGNGFEDAMGLLEQAVKVDPENASPLVQLGAYALRLDLVSDAVFRLEEATELDAQNVDAHELLGEAYYRANDVPSALAQWEWVLEVEPDRSGLREKVEKARREESVEGKFARLASRHFQVTYAPGTRGGDLSRVFTILERARLDIGRKLGNAYPPAPIQVIASTAEDFEKATQLAEYVGAVYDGKIRVPLSDRKGATLDAAELQRRLYHEYTHVVVRYLAGDSVPWWLNEGLAETFSRELSADDVQVLEQAARDKTLFKLSKLESGQLDKLEASALSLAYVQSHASADFLYRQYGAYALNQMLSLLAAGSSGEEALQKAYKRTYATLELDVVGHLTRLAQR